MNYNDRMLAELNSLKLRVESLEKAVSSNKYNQLEFYNIDDSKKKIFDKVFKFNVLKVGTVKFKMNADIGETDGKLYAEIFINGVKVSRFYNETNKLSYEFEASLGVGLSEIKVTFMYVLNYTVHNFKLEIGGNVDYELEPSRIDALKLTDCTIISYLSGSNAYIYKYDTSLKLLCILDAKSVALSAYNNMVAIGFVDSQNELRMRVYRTSDYTTVENQFSLSKIRKVVGSVSQNGFCFYCLKNNRGYKTVIDASFNISSSLLSGSIKDIISTCDDENFYIATDFSGYSKLYYGSSVQKVDKGENYHLFKEGEINYVGFNKKGEYMLKKITGSSQENAVAKAVSDEFVFLHNGKKLLRNKNRININEE